MFIPRGVVRLGAEIEVAKFRPPNSYISTAKQLMKKNYMIGDEKVWEKYHQYHCNCTPGGCSMVKQGMLFDRPIVSMTYDATLPKYGAEFIMSPVLVNESLEHFENVWNIIADNAEWTRDLQDIKGRPCSPSIHLHVSALLGEEDGSAGHPKYQGHADDVLHALSLFSPELFLLASTASVARGVAYRLPDRTSMAMQPGGHHHGFVQVRKTIPGKYVHIEWRLFEAAYKEWDYVEACAYLAAGLTRSLLSEEVFSQLMAVGYQFPIKGNIFKEAVRADDPNIILDAVNYDRLDILRETIIPRLDDNDYARDRVAQLFERASA